MEGYNHAAGHVLMMAVRAYDTCKLLVSYD